ncbi:MAG: DUF952 domain-containing protein [Roseiflexaceae bacterium]
MAQIYHLAPAARWQAWPSDRPYLPAEYEQDGFIHCTAGDALMLRVANHFYRQVVGAFVILVIDTELLTAELRWEQPSDTLAPLFPHIYGPINHAAIMTVRAIRRGDDGTFEEIIAG